MFCNFRFQFQPLKKQIHKRFCTHFTILCDRKKYYKKCIQSAACKISIKRKNEIFLVFIFWYDKKDMIEIERSLFCIFLTSYMLVAFNSQLMWWRCNLIHLSIVYILNNNIYFFHYILLIVIVWLIVLLILYRRDQEGRCKTFYKIL